MSKLYQVLDWDSVQKELNRQETQVDPKEIIKALTAQAQVLDEELHAYAIVAQDDQEAMMAFENEGFQVLRVLPGTRQRVLDRLKRELEDCAFSSGGDVFWLTLVTADPSLESLLRCFVRLKHRVRIWGPETSTPHELRLGEYKFLPLEKVIPGLRIRSAVVLIDWENISIGLQNAGWTLNPEIIADVFRKRASRHGKVRDIYAYADWGALVRTQGQNIQRELEMGGIKTRYVVSIRGKSSSDMEIVDKVHELLQSEEMLDVLILATGDRDFQSVIQTARQRHNKTVVLWGKKGSTSPKVTEVADVVEWVDDFLPAPRQAPVQSGEKAALAASQGIDRLVELIIRISGVLRSNRWEWISPSKLVNCLVRSSNDQALRREAYELVRHAKAEGILHSEERPNPRADTENPTVEALQLNEKHPVVQSSCHVIERVYECIRYALEVRRMPWVTFSYVANGMERDQSLAQAPMARTKEERNRWLNVMIEARLLIAEKRTSPQTCTVLSIPIEPAMEDDLATMVRRIVTSSDSFMAQRGWDWVPLKWLHQRLGPCGDSAFKETIQVLLDAGEATQQYHENERLGRQTLGLHLAQTADMVVALRRERQHILATLQTPIDVQPLTAERIETRLEALQPELITPWMRVLIDEGVIHCDNGTYSINRDHTLIKAESAREVMFQVLPGGARLALQRAAA
jgi:hypothetical protein